MAKALFIDLKENEARGYLLNAKHGGYEHAGTKTYSLSERHDFRFDNIGDVEDILLSLPLSMLSFRVLEMPFADRDRLLEILPYELEGMVLGGSEKVVIDAVTVGMAENKHKVLAVYTDKAVIKDILAKLRAVSIDPVIITSLELRAILKDFSPEKLVQPLELDDRQRVLFALEEAVSPSVNLRRGELASARHIEETGKALKLASILAIIIALVISGDLVFQLIAARNEISNIKKDMRKTYQELYPQEKNIVNELYQLKSHMKELRDKENALVGIAPLEVIRRVSLVHRGSAVFNEINLESDNLTLKGEADTLTDVQQIKDRLMNDFDNVNISDSKSTAGNRMAFTITAKEKRT